MERFTIYCGLMIGQDNHPETIEYVKALAIELADEHLELFTVQETEGRWKGSREPSLVFTFLTKNRVDITKVNAFAHAFKYQAKQDAVLIVEEEVKARFY